jgi:tRNA(Ile)-lysidine synthase
MAASRKFLPSNGVVDSVADAFSRHAVPNNARLVLALSGGLDSVVLFDALQQLRHAHPYTVHAVHVHHGLSPHADDWAAFCAQLCARHDVDLDIRHVNIAPGDPAGVEAAARRERQRIFAALDADVLLTAHQQDDQAETLLLQLLRGAGPKGLAAMPEARRPAGWLALHVRPLLDTPRAALLAYATARGLQWIDDESNRDNRFRRNALRNDVTPRLATYFPGGTRALARAATLQAEAAELLDDLARIDAADAIVGGGLVCAALARLGERRARNLLRHFIELHGYAMPGERALNDALHQLRDARDDARVRVNLGAVEVWRYDGAAYLVPPPPEPALPVRWQGEPRIWVPAAGTDVAMRPVTGAGIRQAALLAGAVSLGVRQGGERLRLRPHGPTRTLKNLLQEHAIPPWQRARLPLMWCDGQLVWAAGIGCDADWAAKPGEPGVLPEVDTTSPRDSEGGRVLS